MSIHVLILKTIDRIVCACETAQLVRKIEKKDNKSMSAFICQSNLMSHIFYLYSASVRRRGGWQEIIIFIVRALYSLTVERDILQIEESISCACSRIIFYRFLSLPLLPYFCPECHVSICRLHFPHLRFARNIFIHSVFSYYHYSDS